MGLSGKRWNGVGVMSFGCGEQAAFEGDREGVECGLPAVHPPTATTSGRVEAPDDHVEALQGGVVAQGSRRALGLLDASWR